MKSKQFNLFKILINNKNKLSKFLELLKLNSSQKR